MCFFISPVMLSHTFKRKGSSLLAKHGFSIKKFTVEDEINVDKMVKFAKEFYYKHKVGAPIATMVTSGRRNDCYAFDEDHIRFILDPLVKGPFGVYKDEDLNGIMMTRITTVEQHFKTPLIPNYAKYFKTQKTPTSKNDSNYNLHEERILTYQLFRGEIDSDSWISENLKPTDKIMFMRIGGTHPSLKGTGITRKFWQDVLKNTAEKAGCVCILSVGTQEQSIFAVERMGFSSVKEVVYDDFSNEFKRRVVTRVRDHPRLVLQVKWLDGSGGLDRVE